MEIVSLSQVAKTLVEMKKRSGRRYVEAYISTKFSPKEVSRSVSASGDAIGVVLFDCRADQIEPGVVHFSAKVG